MDLKKIVFFKLISDNVIEFKFSPYTMLHKLHFIYQSLMKCNL